MIHQVSTASRVISAVPLASIRPRMPPATRPPPAPSKTRALPSRTTRTSARNVDPSSSTAAVATHLERLSLSDAVPARRARTKPTASERTPADTVAQTSSLAAPPPRPRPRPLPAQEASTPAPQLSIEEQAKQASATITANLAFLSNLAKSGFRAELPVRPPGAATPTTSSLSASRSSSLSSKASTVGKERQQAESIAQETGKAFETLRRLGRDNLRLGNKRLSIEQMAGRFIAELIQIQLYRYALLELSAMRRSILSWWIPADATVTSAESQPVTAPLLSHGHALLVPLPPTSYLDPPTLSETLSTSVRRPTIPETVPLVLAMQQSLLNCFFRSTTLSTTPDARRARIEKLHRVLVDGEGAGGALEWKQLAREQELDENERRLLNQKLDSSLFNMFQTIMQGSNPPTTSSSSSSLETDTIKPELLLDLRIQALRYYASTSTFSDRVTESSNEQLSAFVNQLRKVVVRYGREAQGLPWSYPADRIAREVKDAFAKIMQQLTNSGTLDICRKSSEWSEVCQVVLHLAKKANNHELVEMVSADLERESVDASAASKASPARSPSPTESPTEQTSSLIVTFHRILTLFELFNRNLASKPATASSDDATETLVKLLVQAPRLFRTAAQILYPEIPSFSLEDKKVCELDHILHQLRSVFNKYLRTPTTTTTTRQTTSEPLLRSEDLVMLPSRRNFGTGTEQRIGELVRQSLDAFATIAERLSLHPPKANGREEQSDPQRETFLKAKAIETLILLAHDHLSISDRTTYSKTFEYLVRAVPLLRSGTTNKGEQAKLELASMSWSIHSVASCFYNIAARLFSASNNGGGGDGSFTVKFASQTCQLTQEALEAFAAEGSLVANFEALRIEPPEGSQRQEQVKEQVQKRTEERLKILNDLKKNVAKRWELLGLAQHVIEDRKSAYQNYVSAISAQPPTLLESLASDASSESLGYIIDTYSPLVKLVERTTRIATFDLLLPPETVSLAHTLDSALSRDLKGALLEFQLYALDQVFEQTSSQKAANAVLAALDQVYTAREFPIRRARILVRTMQQICVGSSIAQDLKPAALAAEIEELCSSSSIEASQDKLLAPFSAQYLSLSHLYLAFHAHHARIPSATLVVESEARTSLSILRRALESDLPASPSVPLSNTSKVTFLASPVRSPTKNISASTASTATAPSVATTTTRRRTTRAVGSLAAKAHKTPQATRTFASNRKTVVQAQVTPPAKDPLDTIGQFRGNPASAKKTGGSITKPRLDRPEHVYRLLETLSNLLGVLGHTLLQMAFLKFLRRLSSQLPSGGDAAFVTASSVLAHEYLRLGKTVRAGAILAQAEHREKANCDDTRSPAEILRLLTYAEYYAMIGSHDRGARSYQAAMDLAQTIAPPSSTSSPSSKIVEMTLILERAAFASSVFSLMLQRKGDLARSLAPALQAMRLCDRALNNLFRLQASTGSRSPANGSAVFDAAPNNHRTPIEDLAPPAQSPYKIAPGGAHANLSLRLAAQLAQSILRVSVLHLVRGSPKDAEFYASQAVELAENLGSERLTARALCIRAEVEILIGRWDDASNDLGRAEALVGDASSHEAVEVQKLGAELLVRNSLQEQAYSTTLDAQKALETFVRSAAEAESAQTPVKRSASAKSLSPVQQRSATKASSPFHALVASPGFRNSHGADWILPAAQAYILRLQVTMLRLQNKLDESQALLRRLSKLSSLEEDKADELRLLASIHMQDMLTRCISDPVLGMLPDSVLSIPAMSISTVSASVKIGTPRTGPTILNSLKDVDNLLMQAAAYSASRSHPNKIRDLSLITGTMRAFHANVGKSSKRAGVSVAHLLDLGCAVTLRREMLDAIDHKLAQTTPQDDLLWPATAVEGDGEDQPAERQHLLTMRERYRLETPEPALTDAAMSALLPPNWSAVSLHLTPERDNLIIVRHRRDTDPVLFKLPLDRLARREGEEETLTYDDAITELNDIIATTKVNAANAKFVKSREEREAWWQERQQLDERLKDLLQNIEDVWLGAFKSIFCDARCHSPEAFSSFRLRIERILKRGIVRAASDKKSTRFKLNDAIVECVAALSATSREEDLEDLFFFMTEAFQFSGVPVACDETDVDQVVVDLREALEELHGTKSAPKGIVDPNEHTFLVLDKTLAAFPWESIPCLFGRSVSRLPSLSFLRDRFDLALNQASNAATTVNPEITLDARRAAVVLNPGGDLAATQQTFEPLLQKQASWTGIVGRAPQEEELKVALASKDLFLFFGHGGAEQYIRRRVIRHLPKCAVTMLWGCSSGMLKDQGDFDPVGTPYNYMIAGCPALVVNLWDVTDKDIDKFALSVFDKTGITKTRPDGEEDQGKSTKLSLTTAVAQSRTVCNLRYLNGAAPVVYGIPVRFS
ncbi:separase [Sporobolomyces koalae]|uniref:separase n=1 Tax=Sporobolomyces koalae TaxID=500713 RepID=UPI00316E5BDD